MIQLIVTIAVCTYFLCSKIGELVSVLERIHDFIRYGRN